MEVIFNRLILAVIYGFITIVTSFQIILSRSLRLGVGALVACGICLFASSTLGSSFLARHEQQYSARELGTIAVIAAALTLIGLVLVSRSGFWLTIYGFRISGIQWALLGSVIGLITSQKQLVK